MAEEVKVPLPPVHVEVPLTIYINQATTYLGKAILKELSRPASGVPGPAVTEKIEHTFITSDAAPSSELISNKSSYLKVLLYVR